MNRVRLALLGLVGGFWPASLILAEPAVHDHAVCEKLATIIHDPRIDVRLESRADGFVLRMQSQDAESQTAARSFAVEVLKQHDLAADTPQTNGYGLPEQ